VEPRASLAYFNHQTITGFTPDTSDFCRAISLVTFEASSVAYPVYQIISQRDDVPDTIRLQVTLNADLKALRAVLYRLESGTP
jgi:hypothetical protein